MKISILSNSEKPIYEQIYDQIRDSILLGELHEGEAVPSIRKLAKELGISVITTKRAYDDLEKDRYITTIPGKGSYVTSQNTELVKENQVKSLEDKLIDTILTAKSMNLSRGELIDLMLTLYETM